MAVKKRKKAKPLLIFLIIFLIIIVISTITIFILSRPVNKNSKATVEVIIPSGTATSQIGAILKEKRLIRSELYFKFYVKIKGANNLKASTYNMSQNMTLKEIVSTLESGNSYNPDVIRITFKEGERITDFSKDVSEKTNNTYDKVISIMTDKTYINSLINKYWFLTEEILNESIYYPLEGYLAPNTYEFKNKDVSVEEIIDKMLMQTEQNLKQYKNKLTKSVHYYLTMASLAELEGTNLSNKKEIVGVFENRLLKGMNLGSDVTTYYALQLPMDSDLTTAQFTTPNPYNTRSTTMMGKMPIGPICNPSSESLEASINYTTSENLYFVADKYGNIYFTKTLTEHEIKVQQIKENGDWIW